MKIFKRFFSWLVNTSDSEEEIDTYICIYSGGDNSAEVEVSIGAEDDVLDFIKILYFLMSGQCASHAFSQSLEAMTEAGLSKEDISKYVKYLEKLLIEYKNTITEEYDGEEEEPLVDPCNVFRGQRDVEE